MTEMYNKMAEQCDLDVIMNDNHKLALFFNTIIVGPYFEDGELFLRTYLPFEYTVISNPNDKSRMDALLLLNRKEVEADKYEDSVIVWTKEKHYIVTADLNSKNVSENKEKKNPYGTIPFAVLRMRRDNYDFQGCGFDGVIEACLSASVNLTYSNFLMPYNIGGILIAKNTTFDKKKKEPEPGDQLQINGQTVNMTEAAEESVEIAADGVLSLKDTMQGKEASLSFLRLESNLAIVRDEIEWLMKNLLSDLGVDLNSIVLERGYTSGFGIVAESIGLMEIRKAHIPILSKFEKQLFKVIRIVLDHESDIEEYYPEDAELSVDYQEPQFPRTIEEIQKEREMKIKQNTISYLDLIKEDNIDITDNEAAREKLEENYRINKEFESIFGLGNIGTVFNNSEDKETETGFVQDKSNPENFFPVERTAENQLFGNTEQLETNEPLSQGKELDLPNDRQFSYWDCGDAVVVCALARFGIEPNPDDLAKELGSTVDWGTEPESIKSVLESYGLTAELKEMSIEDIFQYIDNNIPVILDIQAWHFNDVKEYDYTNEWNDGHYVTAYGYTSNTIKIKDPSSLSNRELTFEELLKRWHDVDKEGNKIYNIGIAYYGLPVTCSRSKVEAIG